MTLVLRNLQNIVKLRMPQIKKDIETLRRLMTIDKYDVSVLFVTDKHIQELNEGYRQVEGPTDVLAFPALDITEPGIIASSGNDMKSLEELPLGDILLAPAYISRQCQHHHDNFDHVMLTTVTHGLCHLIGHDHETEEQQRHMRQAEQSILDRLNKLTGYSCKPLTVIGH